MIVKLSVERAANAILPDLTNNSPTVSSPKKNVFHALIIAKLQVDFADKSPGVVSSISLAAGTAHLRAVTPSKIQEYCSEYPLTTSWRHSIFQHSTCNQYHIIASSSSASRICCCQENDSIGQSDHSASGESITQFRTSDHR